METEAGDEPDDPVESVELAMRHRVMGRAHEVFDVRCSRSRWWVITNLTNLYRRDEFKTADYASSFHLGLMLHLQRDSSANAWDAELAVNAVNHALESFMYMRLHSDRGGPDECPRCGSHRFGPTSTQTGTPMGRYGSRCAFGASVPEALSIGCSPLQSGQRVPNRRRPS